MSYYITHLFHSRLSYVFFTPQPYDSHRNFDEIQHESQIFLSELVPLWIVIESYVCAMIVVFLNIRFVHRIPNSRTNALTKSKTSPHQTLLNLKDKSSCHNDCARSRHSIPGFCQDFFVCFYDFPDRFDYFVLFHVFHLPNVNYSFFSIFIRGWMFR